MLVIVVVIKCERTPHMYLVMKVGNTFIFCYNAIQEITKLDLTVNQ